MQTTEEKYHWVERDLWLSTHKKCWVEQIPGLTVPVSVVAIVLLWPLALGVLHPAVSYSYKSQSISRVTALRALYVGYLAVGRKGLTYYLCNFWESLKDDFLWEMRVMVWMVERQLLTFPCTLVCGIVCYFEFLTWACVSLIIKILKHVLSGYCVSTMLSAEDIEMNKTWSLPLRVHFLVEVNT